jgi:hypothetical protein
VQQKYSLDPLEPLGLGARNPLVRVLTPGEFLRIEREAGRLR